eukprot:TRINITY_DN17998_c0_g6_i2.p1 TRINITY_DN17998_c0_g6~~TRINITY_DN17998_c0_g6_i2.p1  ORF type:complete len:377 (+),score=143.12 TRINITY_DN17998_c0_g6_i2:126-1133(+)
MSMTISMSPNASRIINGANYIIEKPEDMKRVVGIAKKITQTASVLIDKAKECARDQKDTKKRKIVVVRAQEVVKYATALANGLKNEEKTQLIVEIGKALKNEEKTQEIVEIAKALKDSTISLEEAMASSNGGAKKEEDIDQQLLAISRTITVEAVGVIREADAVVANNDSRSSEDLKRNLQTFYEAIKELVSLSGHLTQESGKTTQGELELIMKTITSSIMEINKPVMAKTNQEGTHQIKDSLQDRFLMNNEVRDSRSSLSPLVILNKDDKPLSFEESIKFGLQDKFDEIFFESNVPFAEELYETNNEHKLTKEQVFSIFYYTLERTNQSIYTLA